MKRDLADALGLPAAQIELALAGVEGSAVFRPSPRHRALLRHLVSRASAEAQHTLKETVIAVEVFGRPAASFDPRTDTIVRVEARRLRARLADYYAGEGRGASIRFDLPVGSYVPLVTAARATPQHDEAVTRRARDLVERGEHFLRQALSRQTLEQALERFTLALRESPAHAPALAGAGRAWFNLAAGWHHPPAVASEHAVEALRAALAIDPDHAVAHVLLGAAVHQYERDWTAAEPSFQRALRIGPRQAFVHSAYGCHLMLHGDYDHAERELVLARSLDPQYVNTRTHMVNLRIAQGRLDDADAEIDGLHDIVPDTLAVIGMRAVIALFRRDAERAVQLYQRCCEVSADYPGSFIALAGAHAMAGRIDVADEIVEATRRRFDETLISPYVLAICATRSCRHDEAFALLERALSERDPNAVQIVFDTSFDDLHADPRWPALAAAARSPHGEA